MKIIGISGSSGAGKSTVSKLLLEELPNSILISGDIYMMEQMQKLDEEIFKKLNIKKEKGVFSSNYVFKSFENQKITFEVIEEDVIKSIKKDIEELGQDKEYIIVDWLFLPMCKFYNECDITICVTADFDIKLTRLTNRMKNETIHKIGTKLLERYHEGIIENRIKFTTLNDYGYKSQYEIDNSTTEEELKTNVKKLVKKINK